MSGRTVDNRNLSEMGDYQQDRIDFMKRRIKQLEEENAALKKILDQPPIRITSALTRRKVFSDPAPAK